MRKNRLKQFTFYEPIKSKIVFIDMDIVNEPQLMMNPFLYTYEKANVLVSSIEDFGVVYDKNNVYYSSVIRNPNIAINKKLKVSKKFFKTHKKDYLKSIVKLATKPLKITKEKLWKKLVVFGLYLLNLYLIWFNFKYNLISSIVMMCIMSLITIEYLYYHIYLTVFQKIYFKMVDKLVRTNKKTFRKAYKKAYKYYIRNIKKGKIEFLPLGFHKLWSNKSDIVVVIEKFNIKSLRIQKYIDFRVYIFKGLMFLLIIANIYFVVLLAINIFKN